MFGLNRPVPPSVLSEMSRYFLPGLLVIGVFIAERAILFEVHSFRVFPFVLGGGVVPLLASFAGQCDYISGHDLLNPSKLTVDESPAGYWPALFFDPLNVLFQYFGDHSGTYRAAALPDGKS